ncbi:MAG TPA: Gfo/Idh/MocA family oxidoreductase [Armatimonadota bacterium]|nr:Gfo/Idh/MocA family oxidoreductase [Armatimonadota bacterium]
MEEQKESQSPTRTTRRTFLRNAGLATAGVLVGDLARSSTYSIAAPRVLGANDRINWGIIGPGGRGTHLMTRLLAMAKANEANLQFTAVCDVYQKRMDSAKAATGGKAYHNYKELLADKDIDVVLIATPEHWHAQMAMDAMEAGKDIYLEKPMTRYLDEAKKLAACVQRTKRVMQVGAQLTEEPRWKKAHELLPTIGKVVACETSYCRNSKEGEWNYPIDADATPDNLDWKAWLGPAKQRPFSTERYFRWRKYWDYSSGIMGDLLPHRIHNLVIALGAEFPTRVCCTGGIYVQKDRDVPDEVHVLADFPSGYTMSAVGSTCNERGPEPMIRGNKATMLLGSATEIKINPERPWVDEVEASSETVEAVPDTEKAHFLNFMDCVRSRAMPTCGLDVAYPVMVTVALAEMSYRENKMMRFDPVKKEIID